MNLVSRLRLFHLPFIIVIISITSSVSRATTTTSACSRAFSDQKDHDQILPLERALDSYNSLKILSGSKIDPNEIEAPLDSLKYWISVDQFPSIVIDGIRIRQVDSEFTEDREAIGFKFCGTCKMMMNIHIRSFILPILRVSDRIDPKVYRKLDRSPREVAGKFALVHLRGRLIGAIKLTGERSFLSLVNAQDSSGATTLSIGGVYSLSQEFKRTVLYPKIEFFLTENKARSVDLPNVADHPSARALSIDVDQLELMPETFLLNRSHLDLPQNTKILSQFLSIAPSGSTSWDAVAHTLNDVRLYLEQIERTPKGLERLRSRLSGRKRPSEPATSPRIPDKI